MSYTQPTYYSSVAEDCC